MKISYLIGAAFIAALILCATTHQANADTKQTTWYLICNDRDVARHVVEKHKEKFTRKSDTVYELTTKGFWGITFFDSSGFRLYFEEVAAEKQDKAPQIMIADPVCSMSKIITTIKSPTKPTKGSGFE